MSAGLVGLVNDPHAESSGAGPAIGNPAPKPAPPPVSSASTTSQSTASRPLPARTTSSTMPSDPLAGHVGHLDAAQEQALNALKALAYAQGLYIREPVPSHDDATLLRYLRARRWDANAAVRQFKEAEAWRKSSHVDEFFIEHDIDVFEQARRVYPCWTGRRTRRGLPYYIYRVNDLDKKTMHHFMDEGGSSKKRGSKINRPMPVVALYEALMQLALPLCTTLSDRPNPETPITTSCNIVDISGVSLMQFLKLKSHFGDASSLATARYPETLDSILVLGAPPFVETVFQFISQWFDENTRAKISILGTNTAANLQRLSSLIDPKDLPKAYGGTLDWKFGDLPNLDPEIERVYGLTSKDWPIGPIKLIGKDIVACGETANGKPRREVIGTFNPQAYASKLADV